MKRIASAALMAVGLTWAMGLGFGVGGDAGYAMSSYSVDTFSTSSSGLIYGGGAVVDLWFMPNMGADLGVRYDLYNYASTENDVDVKTTTTILAIPVFLKYGFPMEGMKPYFGLGFSVLKQMGSKTTVDTMTSEAPDSLLEMDYAVLAGGGLNFPLGPVLLNPNLRFQYNLTAGAEDDTVGSATEYDFLLGVNFLYSLPLGGE